MIARLLRVLGWLRLVDLRRYHRMEDEEQASLKRAERIRTGDFLDDLTTLGGD
jgi:hypothetical protein